MAPLRTEEEKATSDDISQRKQMEDFFEWTPHEYKEPETMGQKFKRKTKENPFVPMGELKKLPPSPCLRPVALKLVISVVMQ